MKLAIFDERRLGVVSVDERSIVDVTDLVPFYDPDPLSGWWRRLCRDFAEIAPRFGDVHGPARPLAEVRLQAPVLNPSKVIACAVNYREHAEEMRSRILERTGLLRKMIPDTMRTLTQSGARLAPERDQVGETLRRHQRGPGAAPLEQRVGGDSHAVRELGDVGRVTAGIREHGTHSGDHAFGLVLGSSR